ncbi:riboflavin transporter [Thermosipho melanesiensis]|uniref:Riboflavin transporter n=2 Tax=Thermosipho melanesiensis TaxID=46541 RepID=A6LLU3_THEM4|nr:ECF transporter S component [Thermosipho melanesiensis]ABR30894.1 membrane protein-like protein [Thermosipho melanesiensis BI429]APT74013.1 riboflavin transporter [Thermosipho melanesiensis]OOC35942.1 riboflavin transporter [Thermosipho melanesiensis]OOC38444.1 riboflavin transporter [Thermosipho melanesiensis]OOC38905.1 riboflavin transporter [Thermosipho melanesiensis]
MKNAKKVAIIGVFAALAFVVMYIEFPIFPTVNFLKYDPSDILALLVAFIYSPTIGIIVLAIKDILFFIFKSGDIVGIAMNFAAGALFIVPAALIYANKGKFREILGYVIGIVAATGGMALLNMVVVPYYWKVPLSEVFKLLPWIIGFNAIKFSIDSVINVIIHKRVRGILEPDERKI